MDFDPEQHQRPRAIEFAYHVRLIGLLVQAAGGVISIPRSAVEDADAPGLNGLMLDVNPDEITDCYVFTLRPYARGGSMPDDITILTVKDAQSRVLYVDSANERSIGTKEVVARLKARFPEAVIVQARVWTYASRVAPGRLSAEMQPRLVSKFTIPLIT